MDTLPSKPAPLRIAFTDSGGANWTGGITYRRNLVEALHRYAPEVEVYRFTDGETSNEEVRGYCRVIRSTPAAGLSGLAARAALRLWGFDLNLRRALDRVPGGVDVIFPGRYTVGRAAAMVYWIPDFQHLHLPEMYSPALIRDLNTKFRQGIERASLVVLSSRHAYNDLVAFAPEAAGKGRVMSFVARVPESVYAAPSESVLTRYDLPERFYYLPNQFWAHKNHTVVLEALRILKGRGVQPFVVMTGNPIDTRRPLFFGELLHQVSVWGLRDQVAFLGLVPHDDVYALMRQSIRVVNPSLFEGWSTSVEEARSLGKRPVLSDIPVHREQDPPGAVYFDPQDGEALADCLEAAWQTARPGPDPELEQRARSTLAGRMQAFAETFTAIAREAALRRGDR